ncbi:MAG: AbgT family transporter [Bacteroidaceae bacterium]
MKIKTRLRHPATLFFSLSFVIAILSWIANSYGASTINPSDGSDIVVQSMLSAEGARWMLRNVFVNFSSFRPLGLVLIGLLGLGITMHSGFVDALLRKFLGQNPRRSLVIVCVIVAGMLANVIGDVGYIFLLPLSARLFQTVKLPPVVGVITGYVSLACAYSANLMLATMDPILANTTIQALAQSNITSYTMTPLSNYLFMAVSVPVLTMVIYYITVRYLIPQWNSENQALDSVETSSFTVASSSSSSSEQPRTFLATYESRALRITGIVAALYIIVLCLATFLPNGFLRGVDGSILRSPLIQSALFLIIFGLGMCGIVYGFTVGHYHNDRDILEGMGYYGQLLSQYIVIVFFASMMIAVMNYTQLGEYLTIYSAGWIERLQIGTIPTLFIFVLYVALVNLLIGSASAKWALMAYIFIPYFADRGLDPAIVQCAYRIGDSATNGITPFFYYLPLFIVLVRQYQPRTTTSHIINYLWRYILAILTVWLLMLGIWLVCI